MASTAAWDKASAWAGATWAKVAAVSAMSASPPGSIATAESRNTDGGSFQGFLGGVQEIGDSLEALARGVSQAGSLVLGTNQQRVQRLEHVRQPKRRVARVGSFGIETVVGNADIIEEGGTVDFVLEIRDLHVFHRFGQ